MAGQDGAATLMARYVPKVLICDTDPRHPIYHAIGVPTEAQLDNRQSVAKCGALLGTWGCW